MAESPDSAGESLENSPNTGSEKGLEDKVSPIEAKTISPKQKTQNMETHAHHLHHAPGKKFWHYLYEFLMLFLAVFCGFLAENRREHMQEQKREKQYILSMIEDLDLDIRNLDSVKNSINSQVKDIDTLLMVFPDKGGPYRHDFFSKINSIYGTPDFIREDRTMQELKNSGAMRLIRNKKSADAITYYDMMNSNLNITVYNMNDVFSALRFYRFEVMKQADLSKDMKEKSQEELEKSGENYWLKSDPQSMGKLKNLINALRMRLTALSSSEEELMNKAVETRSVLKKEYRLE